MTVTVERVYKQHTVRDSKGRQRFATHTYYRAVADPGTVFGTTYGPVRKTEAAAQRDADTLGAHLLTSL